MSQLTNDENSSYLAGSFVYLSNFTQSALNLQTLKNTIETMAMGEDVSDFTVVNALNFHVNIEISCQHHQHCSYSQLLTIATNDDKSTDQTSQIFATIILECPITSLFCVSKGITHACSLGSMWELAWVKSIREDLFLSRHASLLEEGLVPCLMISQRPLSCCGYCEHAM